MQNHIRILGWLHVVLGAIDLLLAMILFGLFAGLGIVVGASGEPAGLLATGVIGTVISGIVTLTAIPNFLAGWGLLTYREWGRWLALILGALNVVKFPWGTAVGIYTFVVLLDDEARARFR